MGGTEHAARRRTAGEADDAPARRSAGTGDDSAPGQTAGEPARRTSGDRDDAPAVVLRDLGRAFGERIALAGVTLELPRGATLAVFGANGAGKTTLLRVLATLLRPHAGEAVVLGRPLPREGWAVRGRIGLLAHEPLLYRDLSARENLRFHARLHGVDDARALELLEAVGMRGRADEPVRSLSRGMGQRVAICRAVLHRPELLLLDEPLANLDPGAADAVAPLIGRASGATRVLISHDAEVGLAEADLVLGLRAGRPEIVASACDVGTDDVRRLYR